MLKTILVKWFMTLGIIVSPAESHKIDLDGNRSSSNDDLRNTISDTKISSMEEINNKSNEKANIRI